MRPITVILVVLVKLVTGELDTYEILNSQSENFHILNKHITNSNVSLHLVNIIREVYPENIVLHGTVNESVCSKQLAEFSSGIEKREEWALKMLDASSKIPSGILAGNQKDLGSYDECVTIALEKEEEEIIRGRHCMYSLILKNRTIPLSLPTLSICLPATCNENDVMEIIQNLINITVDYHNLYLQVQRITCSDVDQPWKIGDVVALSFLFTYLCFLIYCTIHGSICKRHEGFTDNFAGKLSQFSLYTNAKHILSLKIRPGNIAAIQGIRVISIVWMVLGHEYFIQTYGAVSNTADLSNWLKSWRALYVLIAPFTVDTFFALSGFLTSYIFLKKMEKSYTFSLIEYYVHRYVRITPALGGLLLLTIYLFPRMGSGAIWEANMKTQSDYCSKNWWAMFLYIHNYVNTEYLMCLGHTWYLAADMQFFWISPFILYPLLKKPKIGQIILSICMIVSIIVPALLTAENGYSGSISTAQDSEKSNQKQQNFYITSHTRIGPWLLGIFTGYKLFSAEKNSTDMKIMIFGWIGAVLAFAFAVLTYRIFQIDSYGYNVYWEAFYAGFAKNIWAFGVCWLIYASVLGYGGPVNRFLSLPIFAPIGRISYSIYLFHFMVQLMRTSAIRAPFYFSDFNVFHLFISDIFLSILGGFFMSLVFESPFVVLEKLVLEKRTEEHERNSISLSREMHLTVGIDNSGYHHEDDCIDR